MSGDDTAAPTRPKTEPKTRRPKLCKFILLNDDFTPREFVVAVLQGIFRLSEAEAHAVMLTAHQQGVCVVSVYTREIAETRAEQASEAGRLAGFPLAFTIEPEE